MTLTRAPPLPSGILPIAITPQSRSVSSMTPREASAQGRPHCRFLTMSRAPWCWLVRPEDTVPMRSIGNGVFGGTPPSYLARVLRTHPTCLGPILRSVSPWDDWPNLILEDFSKAGGNPRSALQAFFFVCLVEFPFERVKRFTMLFGETRFSG